jgi:vacuolar protein sorting-associated protein 13A/C
VTEGAVYIKFTGYFSGDAPALIINHTTKDITFWEKGNINARLLRPNEMMLYAWINPVGEKQLTWNNGRNKIENDLRKDGLEKFRISEHPEEAYWVSFLDGTQRVLMFTNNPDIAGNVESGSDFIQVTQEIVMDIHGLGLSLVNNEKQCEIMYIGVTSSGVIWEEKKKSRFKPMKIRDNEIVETHYQEYLIKQQITDANPKKYFLEVGKNEIDFATMTLKKSTERQIRRTFYSGVWLEMKSSSHQLQLHVKINKIQIDNQLPDCIFPVVLAPIPPPKSVAALTGLFLFVCFSM